MSRCEILVPTKRGRCYRLTCLLQLAALTAWKRGQLEEMHLSCTCIGMYSNATCQCKGPEIQKNCPRPPLQARQDHALTRLTPNTSKRNLESATAVVGLLHQACSWSELCALCVSSSFLLCSSLAGSVGPPTTTIHVWLHLRCMEGRRALPFHQGIREISACRHGPRPDALRGCLADHR